MIVNKRIIMREFGKIREGGRNGRRAGGAGGGQEGRAPDGERCSGAGASGGGGNPGSRFFKRRTKVPGTVRHCGRKRTEIHGNRNGSVHEVKQTYSDPWIFLGPDGSFDLCLDHEAPVFIAVYDNRVEITPPGGLPRGQTVERAVTGFSKIRNEALAKALNYMHLMEEPPRRADTTARSSRWKQCLRE
ncbi:MAG: hypothetical protein IJK04_15670 [Kiritimatiellae bacterium]|nr:hypothetical protein [Kiritimatiellia bacterium]